ncbi:NADH-quinone oxidoreductase subunit D [Candidatus Marsarchaeota archaeon]|nr:NADH-quinone oxidoreductase subunit D [Candidatus Marsarchaeota archaeon]
MRLNVGPIHPSTHGVLRLVVDVNGDTIEHLETHIGFLHRGIEKLMETRMYMQNPSYTEKMDYVAPLAWDDLYVNAVEMAQGKEVKDDAQYARVILNEFQRIASHLLWLGTFCNDLGQMFTMFMWCFRDRAQVIKFLEDVSGSRMFYVNMRVGGLDKPLPPNFKERAYKLTDYIENHITEYPGILDGNSIFLERTKGVGILKRDDAVNMGAAGPVLRAAGIEEDVRKAEPHNPFFQLKFKIPTSNKSDTYARYRVRYEEMFESIKIIRQALDALPEVPDVTGMPIKLIGPQANPAPVLVRHELPRGEGIIYMVPDKQRPYRIYMRSPTYMNLSLLEKIAVGQKFADLFSILGGLDVIMAEIDK